LKDFGKRGIATGINFYRASILVGLAQGGLSVPVYFGSPFASDETLMRKLEVFGN
jgi:hypothetical protein